MENTPISSGERPVSFTACWRAVMAANSEGVMTGAMWLMSLGKRMEIRRTTAGQAGEISGMGRSDSLRIRSRAKPESISQAADASYTWSKPSSKRPLRTMSTSSRF